MMDFSTSKIDIVGKAKLWLIISGIVVAIGLIAMAIRTVEGGFPLKRGIDFEGGSLFTCNFPGWGTENPANFAQDIKILIEKFTGKEPIVQTTLANGDLLVQIRASADLIDNDAAHEQLIKLIESKGGDVNNMEEDSVTPLIGKELTQKAVLGVIVGLGLILVYITFRLSFDFALFAIIALIQDLVFLTGFFAIFGFEINSPWVAVVLTVVGYSINDTIIIYDRIRENMKVKRHLPFDKLVNLSLLETMARSINTAGTTLLAILAILILGGYSLRTFMIGLGVGIAAGTYSSIFIAAPLLVLWRAHKKGQLAIEREPAKITDDIDSDLQEDDDEESTEAELIRVNSSPAGERKSAPKKKRRRRY